MGTVAEFILPLQALVFLWITPGVRNNPATKVLSILGLPKFDEVPSLALLEFH